MIDQDMQAALGVISYQGRWALILDSVGELGPTLSLEGRLFGRAGPQTVLQYLWGRWAPQHTFPKFCLFDFVIKGMGPDIRQCGGAGPHTVARKQ